MIDVDDVVSGGSIDQNRIPAGAAIHGIVAGDTGREGIVAVVTHQHIVRAAAENLIVAVVTMDDLRGKRQRPY